MKTKLAAASAAVALVLIASAALPADGSSLGPRSPLVRLTTGGNASANGVALDVAPDLTAVAAWHTQPTSGNLRIEAALRDSSLNWTPRVVLGTGAAQYAYSPSAAAGSGGFAAVAWHEDGPTMAYAAIYDPASGWSAPMPLNNGNGTSGFARVAPFGGGSFAFLWREQVLANWVPFMRAWYPGFGWLQIDRLGDFGEQTTDADIAGNGLGDLTASWSYVDGAFTSVKAWTYDRDEGDKGVEIVGTVSNSINYIKAGQGPDGTAVVGWGERIELGFERSYSIGAAVRSPGGTWTRNTTLSESAADDFGFAVAAGSAGAASAAFRAEPSPGTFELRVRSFDPEVGWAASQVLETGDVNYPAIGYSSSGPIAALWQHSDGSGFEMHSSLYTAAEGWSPPAPLAPGERAQSGATDIVLDDLGGGAALWVDAARNVVVSTFAEGLAPALEILAPQDRSTVGALSVLVIIAGDAGATLSGGLFSGSMPASGTASVVAALTAGLNTFWVNATDATGNTVSRSFTVFAVDPASATEDQLQATLDALNATQAELNATRAALNDTQQQLDQVNDTGTAAIFELTLSRDKLEDDLASLANQSAAQEAESAATIANLTEQTQQLSIQMGILQMQQAAAKETSDKLAADSMRLQRGSQSAEVFGLAGLAVGAAAVALALYLNRRNRPTSGDPHPDSPKDP